MNHPILENLYKKVNLGEFAKSWFPIKAVSSTGRVRMGDMFGIRDKSVFLYRSTALAGIGGLLATGRPVKETRRPYCINLLNLI